MERIQDPETPATSERPSFVRLKEVAARVGAPVACLTRGEGISARQWGLPEDTPRIPDFRRLRMAEVADVIAELTGVARARMDCVSGTFVRD